MGCSLYPEARFNAEALAERTDVPEAMHSDGGSDYQKNSWSHTTDDSLRNKVQKFIQQCSVQSSVLFFKHFFPILVGKAVSVVLS